MIYRSMGASLRGPARLSVLLAAICTFLIALAGSFGHTHRSDGGATSSVRAEGHGCVACSLLGFERPPIEDRPSSQGPLIWAAIDSPLRTDAPTLSVAHPPTLRGPPTLS